MSYETSRAVEGKQREISSRKQQRRVPTMCKKKKKPVSNLLTIYRSLAEFQTILAVCRDAWLSAKRKKLVWGVWVRTCMSKIGTDREKFEQVRAGFRYTRIARTSESFKVSEYRNSIRLSATDLWFMYQHERTGRLSLCQFDESLNIWITFSSF